MNKFDKISAAISGTGRGPLPYSFWSHFPEIDLDPSLLADRTAELVDTYDIDFIKTAPNGMFSVEDYGCVCDYSEIKRGGVARIVKHPVESIADWGSIPTVECDEGAFKRELASLKRLLDKVRNTAPVIATAFSPLTTAAKMSNKRIFQHIQEKDTTLVHRALASIAETTSAYIQEAIRLGASGVFYAIQVGSTDVIDEQRFREYGQRYDEIALKGCAKGWFNVVHMHGNSIMFDIMKDYPVNVLNWHISETPPTIREARQKTSKCFMGGINRMDVTTDNRERLAEQIRKVFEDSEGSKQIITPGCVIRYPFKADVLQYLKGLIDMHNKEVRST